MSTSISALIPELQPFARALLGVAGSAGLQPRITSTRRSYAEQTRLYRRFLAGQNPYPVAPPGTSAHEAGYAFDMMIQDVPRRMIVDLEDLGSVWKSWGGVWGGDFKDPIHFEFPGFNGQALQKAFFDDPPDWYVSVANFAAGFLPGTVGLLQAVSPTPTFAKGKSPCPWWDPFGFLTDCAS